MTSALRAKGDINEFQIKAIDALFLFGEDIERYLDDFGRRLSHFHHLNDLLKNAKDDERPKLADNLAKEVGVLSNEFNVMKKTFAPYLKLGIKDLNHLWKRT